MSAPQSIDSQVLARCLDGIATAEDRVALEAWIGGLPARRALLAQLEAGWRADAERLAAPPAADAVWARLSRQLDLPDIETRPTPPPRVLRLVPARAPASRGRRAAKWAAAIAGLAAVSAGIWQVARRPGSSAAPTLAASAPQTREYTTPRGQRASFRLADGSEVVLNAESRLRVPLEFGAPGSFRTVTLEGQGYFTVVHDDRRPFIVRTARGVTRDVGTRFDIRAYADDSVDRVAVTEGEVSVRGAVAYSTSEMHLRAGQMAIVDSSGRVASIANAPIAREVAWTGGRLELRNVSMTEAARLLGRWYGLEIRVADSALASRFVSGSYANEPVADVLTMVIAAVGARYVWRGNVVTMHLTDPSR